jgi:hypothetical protein
MPLLEHDTTELTLAESKKALSEALRNFQNQTEEIQANEKRLAEALKDEQDLLGASMDETEQVGKLSQTAARQRLLSSKIEKARGQLESSESELRQRVEETHRSFCQALSALLDARKTKHLDRLKEMVEPAQWVWAEAHATAFIWHTPDLQLLDSLGGKTAMLVRSGTPRKAAENLLDDIAKLEAEKAAER